VQTCCLLLLVPTLMTSSADCWLQLAFADWLDGFNRVWRLCTRYVTHFIWHITEVSWWYCLPPTKEEVYVFARVCMSVCLSVSKITQKRMQGMIVMKCCVSTDVGTWTNWLTFEPDPDYSPDAGTGLLSLISFKRCYAEFYVGKIPRILIGFCSEAWF